MVWNRPDSAHSARLVRVYLQYEDLGGVRPGVGVVPGGVLVHAGPSLQLPWIPVFRDVVPGGQVLQDGITVIRGQVSQS